MECGPENLGYRNEGDIMRDFPEDSFSHPVSPACNTCKHFNRDSEYPSCKAFDRVPDLILNCDVDHKKPVRGDNGIQWEPIE